MGNELSRTGMSRAARSPSLSTARAAGAALVLGVGLGGTAALGDEPPGDPSQRGASEPALWEPTANAADVPSEPGELAETAYDVPGQVVVDARDDLDTSALAALAAAFGVSFTPSDLESETRIEIATVPIGAEAEMAARFAADPRVELAEPLARVRALFVPNDPLLKDQWHMERIGATRAWDFATGRGATVAVVDTGIACETHGPFTKGTDLESTTCLTGWNFVSGNEHANDDQGHGTHVAGTIAQSTNNGLGAVGVAFHAALLPVKVLNESGWGSTTDVADGIRWAADHGAHVINLSLGGPRNSRVL